MLEQLVKDMPSYKGLWTSLKMRKRLVSAAQCAIKMRSKESDRVKALSLLEDVINVPRHWFGVTVFSKSYFILIGYKL